MKYVLTHTDNSKLNLHTRTPYSSVLEASVSNIWQGYNELTLKVSVEGVPGWKHFDKIQIDDIDYYLNEWNESEHIDERVSTYTLHFYGPEKMIIEASPLTDMDEDGVSVFRKLTSVTGDLPFFGNMICNCINYRHYNPQTGLRVKQNTVKLGTYPADTKHLNVDFSESNAFAGLKAICEKFGVSYSLERNTQGDTDYILNFGTDQSVFPVPLSYGKGKGLYAIRRKSLNTKNIKTILTVLGSSKNLPVDYGKNNLELDPTLYPGSIIADATKIAKYGAWNEIYQNEEIMPSRLGTITAIDEADVLSFIDTTLDFDPTGGSVNIVTGQLAGNNFKIKKYSSTTNKITIEPLTDENGFTKPSVAPYLFAPGDEYYLVDIPMPASYLTAAQEELAEAGNAEYDRISQPQVAYEVSLHGKFLRKHEVRPRVGMYLPVSDVRWGVDKAILITKIKRDLLKQDDWGYECEISDDPGESLAVALYKRIQQAGINTKKQEKNQISTIAALRSFAEEKASESLMASEVYAAAQAEAAQLAAQAYADGEIDAEEARAIADATAKMNEAKSYALAQAQAAESAAKTYAEAQAEAARSAAEAVAEAEAESAEISAKAYADGVVSAEEQRAIAEAAAKLTEAKNYAATQASAAEAAANTYSEAQAEAARLAAIASAKTYTDTEVTAAKGYADSTAAAAQSAAEAYALARANLAETNAEAYADGIVDAEEAARIAEAQAKLNEAKTYAETKATAAENAAKAYADIKKTEAIAAAEAAAEAEALAAETAAKAYADGEITAEEQARIADVNAKLATAKTYAETKASEAQTAAQQYAATAASNAQSAAQSYALSKANYAQAQAEAHADGIVTAEETARINDAAAKLAEAKTYAETKATEAKNAAEAAAALDATAKANAAKSATESYALAKANLAETNAKAHADGIVDAEEARAIADATAKANAAKAAAEAAAKAYTDTGLGTKQNADERIDNIISTSGLPYRADLVIYGESNKYYPVYIFGGNQDLIRTVKIWRVYHEQAPADWYSSTHKGSLMLTWKGNFGGWGGAVYRHTIEELACQYTELMAYCQHACHYMAYCFHLRGGGATGAIYHFASDQTFGTPWTGGTAPAVYYNGASDIVYPNDNIAYRVTAFEPLTSVNSTFLNSIKLANQASVDAVATTKMNAAKDAIAVSEGYANFADKLSKAVLTINGLLNSQIINVDDLFANTAFISKLVAFSAFIENLTVRKLLTPVGGDNAYIEIKEPTTADPYARITITGANASVWSTFAKMFVESDAVSGLESPSAAFEINTVWGTANRRIARVAMDGFASILQWGINTPEGEGGLRGLYNDWGAVVEYCPIGGEYAIKIKLTYNTAASAVEFVLDDLPTSNPGGSVTVWKDSKGFLRIGAAVAYTAADVGALPTNTIQYFTQAQWNALTQAQKDAVPLALVQE